MVLRAQAYPVRVARCSKLAVPICASPPEPTPHPLLSQDLLPLSRFTRRRATAYTLLGPPAAHSHLQFGHCLRQRLAERLGRQRCNRSARQQCDASKDGLRQPAGKGHDKRRGGTAHPRSRRAETHCSGAEFGREELRGEDEYAPECRRDEKLAEHGCGDDEHTRREDDACGAPDAAQEEGEAERALPADTLKQVRCDDVRRQLDDHLTGWTSCEKQQQQSGSAAAAAERVSSSSSRVGQQQQQHSGSAAAAAERANRLSTLATANSIADGCEDHFTHPETKVEEEAATQVASVE